MVRQGRLAFTGPLLASLLLQLVLLPAPSSAALSYDIYNETELDHSRDSTGDFYFGPIPPGKISCEVVNNQIVNLETDSLKH